MGLIVVCTSSGGEDGGYGLLRDFATGGGDGDGEWSRVNGVVGR